MPFSLLLTLTKFHSPESCLRARLLHQQGRGGEDRDSGGAGSSKPSIFEMIKDTGTHIRMHGYAKGPVGVQNEQDTGFYGDRKAAKNSV